MIVFTQTVGNDPVFLRVVRRIFYLERDYYSDCYYEYVGDRVVRHAGGMFYETNDGRISSHCLLLNGEHPEFPESFNSFLSTFYRAFTMEAAYAKRVNIPVDWILHERRDPDSQCFDAIFPKPKMAETLDRKPVYREMFSVGDMAPLFLAFLSHHGGLYLQKNFAMCVGHGHSWSSYPHRLFERIVKRFTPQGSSDHQSQISLYVSDGRYIVLDVLRFYATTCEYYRDSLDLYHLITDMPPGRDINDYLQRDYYPSHHHPDHMWEPSAGD